MELQQLISAVISQEGEDPCSSTSETNVCLETSEKVRTERILKMNTSFYSSRVESSLRFLGHSVGRACYSRRHVKCASWCLPLLFDIQQSCFQLQTFRMSERSVLASSSPDKWPAFLYLLRGSIRYHGGGNRWGQGAALPSIPLITAKDCGKTFDLLTLLEKALNCLFPCKQTPPSIYSYEFGRNSLNIP